MPTEPLLRPADALVADPFAEATPPRRAAAGVPGDREQRFWLGLLGVLGAVAALEVLSRSGLVARRYLPPPTEVLPELWRLLGEAAFWDAVGATAGGWALGFGLAAVGGIALGILCGAHPAVRAFTASTIDFLRPVPSVAFIPVVVLLFGAETGSKVTLVVYAAIWPVVIQVIYGITEVDATARDTARSLHLDPLSRLWHLVWPAALPFALTGLRLSASVALVVCVAAELIIGIEGIGNAIASARDGASMTRMYALIVAAGVIGVLVNLALRLLQAWALRHHPPDRAGRRSA